MGGWVVRVARYDPHHPSASIALHPSAIAASISRADFLSMRPANSFTAYLPVMPWKPTPALSDSIKIAI